MGLRCPHCNEEVSSLDIHCSPQADYALRRLAAKHMREKHGVSSTENEEEQK